jgi:N-acetyl sugar amidotransferase
MGKQKKSLAKKRKVIRCTRCTQDLTIPGIKFDKDGVCNFCLLHQKMERIFPNDHKGFKILSRIIKQVKKEGKNKKYDCVVGISGGRDSTFLLYKSVKDWGLRPLAVHFNDGFDNPIAGENMIKACRKLKVDLRTVTSDWRESKDLKISFLKASVPELNMGTDIGIASSLYGIAHKENLKSILIGQSFRTEGIKPLVWSFFDGNYLKDVQKRFGSVILRKWTPDNPGFNLGRKELFYYVFLKRIRTFTPLYYSNYIRENAEEIIKKELGWVYPGAHYFDDLYHSLIKYVTRKKFKFDLNLNSDAALVRSGQLKYKDALKRAHKIYRIEDKKIINLCIKRLGLTNEEFNYFMTIPPKTFHDYSTSYSYIRFFRVIVWAFSQVNLFPKVTYYKYFKCGK